MSDVFELEWLGGATEHFFRRARPDAEKVPWGTIDTSRYAPELLRAVRRSWTEVSMNEYRAVASFAEVIRALADAMAPLDMIGMASDFLADEVLHTELAARVAMELGGAAPMEIDVERFAIRADRALPPRMRANEVIVRVCCVGEAFALGVGTPALSLASHPMIRAVNEIIMADESRHRRLGALYLDWASADFDDRERARLSRVLEDAMRGLRPFWSGEPGAVKDGVTSRGFRVDHLHELGWLEAARAVPNAKAVAQDLLEPLERHGIVLADETRASLFEN
ncbi:MAG TPA: hypothetical protein VGH28_33645 [Polyangiaceae bacterium]|jgi:hypothetical protein